MAEPEFLVSHFHHRIVDMMTEPPARPHPAPIVRTTREPAAARA
jgi:hypothetical protein